MALWKKDKKKGVPLKGAKVRTVSASERPAAMKEFARLAAQARSAHLAKHPEDATPAELTQMAAPEADSGQPSAAGGGIPPQPLPSATGPGSDFDKPTPVTSGVLKFPDGEIANIQSSIVGPAFTDVTLSGPMPNRFHWSTHVEGHAAAAMRQRGATEAELTTNHPDGLCRACDFQAPAMMPPGAVMKVITPARDGTRVQWLSHAGVTEHDPREPPLRATGSRVRLAPGGCWADGDQWFESWDALWPLLSQAVGRQPFFYDVSHESNGFRPFSLISTADGTAVVSFERSAGPFLMRSYGAHLHGLDKLGPSAWRTPIVEWTVPQESPVSFCIPIVNFLPPDHVDHTVREWIDPNRESTVFHEYPVFPWGP